jgi:hypothetical protein
MRVTRCGCCGRMTYASLDRTGTPRVYVCPTCDWPGSAVVGKPGWRTRLTKIRRWWRGR